MRLSTLSIDELAINVKTEGDLRDTLVSGGIEVVCVDERHYGRDDEEREGRERGWVGWGRSELWGIVYIRMGTEGACLRWKTKTPGIICPRRGAGKLL